MALMLMDSSSDYMPEPADTPPPAPVPIEKYFFEDGDCLFLVEGVFFKLHKLFLCRDPESMFLGMFSIPQGSASRATDLEPIKLTGDSAEEFRALCWALYALPSEIHLQTTPDADVPRLVNVARMCHKYTMPGFETWALDMIHIQCRAGSDYLSDCPPPMLDSLMELAVLCDHSAMLSLVEESWMNRIRAGLHHNDALVAGEKHGRRRFLADVYYHLNKELCLSTLSPVSGFSHLNLTHQQLLRLLSGHALLTNFWLGFYERDFPDPPSITCYNHYYCVSEWQSQSSKPSDISDVLAALHRAKSSSSRLCVKQRFDEAVSGFNLVDYFFQPEATG
ncbi:hypothetical protein B0H11DRAFT_1972480 [Mycena galericulata]|nr:hypothetical protein B0H11DRAFT_1972480 [Mycena galericulata]